MRPLVAAALCLAVGGCLPPGFPETAEGDPEAPPGYPEILPLSALLTPRPPLPEADDPDPVLRERGEDLRRRAAAVRTTPPPAPSAEEGARASDLRRRATETRAAP